MKRLTTLFTLVAVLLLSGVTACTKVPPGEVGIVVATNGDQKDAKDFPIRRGWVAYNPLTQDVYTFPTFIQNATWTANTAEGKGADESISFASSDRAVISADIALAYAFVPEKVSGVFLKYRKSADEITHGFMRNKVRAAFSDVASQYKAEDILGPMKPKFITQVHDSLKARLGPDGFLFETVDFIGSPRPPQGVQAAINAALQATQDAQTAENQLRKVQAEQAKELAASEGLAKRTLIEAEAEAKANTLKQQTLSDNLIRQQAIAKWDGKLPQVSGGATPMLNTILGKQ